jgi:polyhydroxybutyrate depolymerase
LIRSEDKIMKRLLLLSMFSAIALILISCGGNSGGGPNAGLGNAPACDTVQSPTCHSMSVTQSDGTIVTRYYVLHVPANFPANSGALVVSLHGTGEGGLEYERHTQLDTTADQNGFAIAYPDALLAPRNGNLRQWNFFYNGAQSDTDTSPDDVAFLRQLITTLQANLQADPKKIYVSGVSAGGNMAVRVGVELSDLVAAIAPLSGTLLQGGNGVAVPAAVGPVSVIMLHADQDTTLPYCGGNGAASQDTTFNYWVAADVTPNLDTAAPLCDASGNPTAVNEKDATGGLLNTEVKFYRLIGAGHFAVYDNADLSAYNPNFNATTGTLSNDIVWKFFAAHPKP